jgi:DNA-binding response OmpR family regulator
MSAESTERAPLQGKVLYIEDAAINAALMRAMLEAHPGIELQLAECGRDGVRMVRENRPDFVILDMNLPDISGLEVVRELSEDIAARGLRITILTADTLSMDIIKAMSLGAFEYWTKPVSMAVLESGLRRALTGRRPHPDRHLPRGRAAR